MARIGGILFLAVGILSTSIYGFELSSAKDFFSKVINKTNDYVTEQRYNIDLDVPGNARLVRSSTKSEFCRQEGFFSYPGDCTMVILCKYGQEMLFTCAYKSHFNNITKKCEEFCSAHCDPALACLCGWDTCQKSVTQKQTQYDQYDFSLDLPENAHFIDDDETTNYCLSEGLVPVAGSCSVGMNCAGGQIANFFECDDGLHFNNFTKRCEDLCAAHCDPALACECGWDNCQNSLQELDVTGDVSETSFTCFKDGLFSHPKNCNRYIQCSNGIADTMMCPPGLHFNEETEQCEEPCNAKCDLRFDCDGKRNQNNFVQKRKSKDLPLRVPDHAHVTYSNDLLAVWFQDGLKPHSNNCSMGTIFNNHNYKLFVCSDGLHFNNFTKKCEDFCSAHCDPALACQCGWDICENSTKLVAMEESSTLDIAKDKFKTSKFCEREGYFADPVNCNRYTFCSHGIGISQECPYGFHFNKKTKQCDTPCNAKCDPTISCRRKSNRIGFTENLKQYDFSVDLPENARLIDEKSSRYLCLRDGLVAFPGTCTVSVQCKGTYFAKFFECDEGYHFNNVTKECEDFCSARCDQNLACECGWETCEKEPDASFTCPRSGLFSHPKNCNQYIQCSNGLPYTMKCPYGLHFSKKTGQCEEPCDAACDPTLNCDRISNQNNFLERQTQNGPNSDVPKNAHVMNLKDFYTILKPDGVKPHSCNCSLGMIWKSGDFNIFQCDEGLHFNNLTKTCEDFCSAHCDPDLACKCDWNSCQNPTEEPFTCPKNGLFPHSENCNQYIQCANGLPYTMTCPSGLHFSKETEQCESPCDAKCDPTVSCKWKSSQNPEIEPEKIFRPPRHCFKEGLLPHPINCNQYIQCSNSKIYIKTCPSGLHFSKVLERCESPYVAGCLPMLNPTRNPDVIDDDSEILSTCLKDGLFPHPVNCNQYIQCSNGLPYTMTCPYGLHFSEKLERCETPHVAACDPIFNSTSNPDVIFTCLKDGLFPHPVNCNQYIQCSNGSPYTMTCRAGLHFNKILERCDVSFVAGCDPIFNPTGKSDVIDADFKASFTCYEDRLFPHPVNCNQYIQCSNGLPYTMTCPPGLHFSMKMNRCENPDTAACDAPIISFIEKQEEYDFNRDLPENAHFIDNSADDLGFCKQDGFIPMFGSCTVGFSCKGEFVEEIFKCDDGFHFNNVTKECEDFCSAHCDSALACECGWDTCPNPTEEPDDSFTCPRNGLFSHSKNCNQYIQCSNGSPYTMTCPYGLHFSKKTEHCEEPCEAACDPTLNCDRILNQIDFVEKQKQIDPALAIPKNSHVVNLDELIEDLKQEGLKPHSTNCSMGFIFRHDNYRTFVCSDGLHFNNFTKKCEDFCSAHCDPALACQCGRDTCQKLTEEPDDSFTCLEDSLFPHPKTCNKYMQCSNGIVYTMTCPSGLHFSKETKQCENPCDAKCDPTVSCERKSNQKVSRVNESLKKYFTLKLKFVCSEDGVFANPKDCNKYTNCSNGVAYDLSCPFNLHFNNETGRCTTPCFAKCDPNACKWRDFKNTVSKETATTICSKGGAYMVENPSDCKSYFNCANGDGVLDFCDEGQHFNPDTLRCEEPCDAHCDPSMAEKCGWADTLQIASSLKQPIFDFTCPRNGFYPNQFACESFIQCSGGQAYLIDCPQGLHYNTLVKRCMPPCDAQCVQNYEEYCKYEKTYLSSKQTLKDFDCQTDGYHSDPIDCESFIQCFRGSAYAISCPPGLHYSPTLEICMTPCEAKCAPDYKAYCKLEEESAIYWSKQEPFSLSEFTCPQENGVHPNPANCTSYIECMMGQHITRDCPAGLHFSIKTEKCELPCDAYCDYSMGDYCGWEDPGSIEGPKDFTFNLDTFLSINSPDHLYHVSCMLDGRYKDPNDCSRFIQCDNQHPYIMQCPEGQHFNEESRECDRPCNAHCNVTLACECGWDACKDQVEPTDEVYCEAKPDKGPCYMRSLRFYYDVESGRCRTFYYGGCGGNNNNFQTMEECEQKCQKRLLSGFKCPFDSGKFGHFPDCVSYYQCKMGVPFLKRCPQGMAFDHKKAKCVTEYEANCVYTCRDTDAVYPYEEDCRKYIDCVNGVSKLERCPPGKAFDPVEKDCVEEKLVSTCLWSSETEN